jgi:S1-C subfamily serine protease
VTKGEISSLSGLQDDPCHYQITVPIQPGNSGGPLIDESGNVVGLINSRVNDRYAYLTSGMLPQNVNYAVKCSYIVPLLDLIPECGESRPEKKKEILPFQDAVQEAIPAICLVFVY